MAENIAYACPGASLDEVVSAARRAHAHEFINRLDEATSSLDSVTEHLIQDAIATLIRDRTARTNGAYRRMFDMQTLGFIDDTLADSA